MSFTPPIFNLNVNIWRQGNATSNPPDIVTVGNLALGRRVGQVQSKISTGSTMQGSMWLLLPAGTDIRDIFTAGGADTVEVGAGSGRFYDVIWVDDAGGGFSNEHRFAELIKQSSWPVPIPTPGSSSPPPPPLDTWHFLASGDNSGVSTTMGFLDIFNRTTRIVIMAYIDTGGGGLPLVGSMSGNHFPNFEVQTSVPGGGAMRLAIYSLIGDVTTETLTLTISVPDLIFYSLLESNVASLTQSGGNIGNANPMQDNLSSPTTVASQPVFGATVDAGTFGGPSAWGAPFPPLTTTPERVQIDSLGNGWLFAVSTTIYTTPGNPLFNITDSPSALSTYAAVAGAGG